MVLDRIVIAFLTVRLKDGRRYAANNMQIIRAGWGEDYKRQILAFECSGVLERFDVDDVAAVEFGVNADVELPASV